MEAAAIFLDAEKAFDSVEWGFMLSVLRRVGVGDVFLRLVRVMYTMPSAHVRLNGLVSGFIDVMRGFGRVVPFRRCCMLWWQSLWYVHCVSITHTEGYTSHTII